METVDQHEKDRSATIPFSSCETNNLYIYGRKRTPIRKVIQIPGFRTNR